MQIKKYDLFHIMLKFNKKVWLLLWPTENYEFLWPLRYPVIKILVFWRRYVTDINNVEGQHISPGLKLTLLLQNIAHHFGPKTQFGHFWGGWGIYMSLIRTRPIFSTFHHIKEKNIHLKLSKKIIFHSP